MSRCKLGCNSVVTPQRDPGMGLRAGIPILPCGVATNLMKGMDTTTQHSTALYSFYRKGDLKCYTISECCTKCIPMETAAEM